MRGYWIAWRVWRLERMTKEGRRRFSVVHPYAWNLIKLAVLSTMILFMGWFCWEFTHAWLTESSCQLQGTC